MKTKEDKLKLLEETAQFYNTGNRSVIRISCRYFLPNKPGCAIGRLIADKKLCRKLDVFSDGSSVRAVFSYLPEDLKNYGVNFLEMLQELHDRESNWTETGLSALGLRHVEKMKADIEEGVI